MAQIDLRHADLYVKDGTSLVGAINQPMTAPANGNTSITVNGFTQAIPAGIQMSIVGSTGTYTVVSTTGGSTPTGITFTPALATADGIPVNSAAVTVGPNILTIKVGEGNLTFEEKRAVEYVTEKNQIALGFVRLGKDEPMDVSLDFIWDFLTYGSGQPPTVEEAIKGTGNASTWTTAGSDPCEPYAVIIECVYTPPCPGVDAEIVSLLEFRWESVNHDLKQGTISAKGKCKILQPTATRVPQPAMP